MKLKHVIIVWILILGLGLLFGHKRITSFPKHIHAWAEGGQYAIALGFIENGFNFFEPETFVLNPQFPGKNDLTKSTGITSVDFPIVQYLVAAVMKTTGYSSPFIYRSFIFLYSCFGLFFLFKLSYLVTQSLARSYLVLLFVLSSPVFVYYQTGMLISMPALSTAFISLYFLTKYLKNNSFPSLIWAITFISFSAAIRTTYLILFGAIGLFLLIDSLRKRKFSFSTFLLLFLGLSFVLAYRYYNHLLSAEHGSIFLNQFLMASSVPEFFDYIQMTWNNWKLDYFSKVHYLIFGIIVIGGSIILFRNKRSLSFIQNSIFFISIAALFADILFLIVMSRQFPQHDYYFLDTFFLPLILLLITSISLFPLFRSKNLKYVVVSLLFLPAILHAFNVQENRIDERYWNEVISTVNSMEDSDDLLNCLGIRSSAKVLILGTHGGNLPLIQTNRKGYTLLTRTSKESIIEALRWDYDYLLLPHDLFLTKIFPHYPEIIKQFERIGGNLKLGVYEKSPKEDRKLTEFLGLSNFNNHFFKKIDFESKNSDIYSEKMITSLNQFSGKNSLFIAPEDKFGLKLHIANLNPIGVKQIAYVSAKVHLETKSAINLVMVAKQKEELLFYEPKNLSELIDETGSWEDLHLMYELPLLTNNKATIDFYFWNNGGNKVYVDDLKIQVLSHKKDCVND